MISWTIVKVELRVVLSAEAQGYPKAESNIDIFLLNYIIFTAVRASLEVSEQGSRPNLHRDDNRDKNFRFQPTMYLDFFNHNARDLHHNSLHAHCLYIPTSAGVVGCMKFVEVSWNPNVSLGWISLFTTWYCHKAFWWSLKRLAVIG